MNISDGCRQSNQGLRQSAYRRRAVLLLAILPIVTLALVQPTSPTVAAAGQTAEIQQLEIQSYKEDFGVPTETAERNLAVQHRAPGIVDQLKVVQGRHYAGIWFDNEVGEFVVPLTDRVSRGAVKRSLVRANLEGDFRIESVQYSWKELVEAHEQIDRALLPLIQAHLVETSLDPSTNAVVISEAEATSDVEQSEIQRLAADLSVSVEVSPQAVQRFSAETTACNLYGTEVRVCDKPLRAGVFIQPSGTAPGSCTAGFKAIGNGSGNRFMLTAGHCYELANHWKSWDAEGFGHYLGAMEEVAFPGNDWAKIRVNGKTAEGDNDWWEKEFSYWPSELAYWYSGATHEDIGVIYESSSYLGQTVCHSGTTTGTSCGTVVALDKTKGYPAGTVYHITEAAGGELCTWGGDSGGPVFAGVTALGIVSGAYTTSCGGHAVFYTEITAATAAMGVSVGTQAGAQPYAETTAASAVKAHEVTGNGTVDPNGLSTEYHFAYGTTTEYGSSTQNWNAGSGWQTSTVSGLIPNLQANTTYHYRVVAANTAGYSLGNDQQFTTLAVPPTVSTGPAIVESPSQALLTGIVNPQNSKTNYYFQYGKTTSYEWESASQSAGSGSSSTPVSYEIAALEPDTLYHVRLVASNPQGTTYGQDVTFTTQSTPPLFSFAFGSKGSGAGQFNAPIGLAVDSEDNIWVSDGENYRIQKFTSKGEYLTKVGTYGSGNGQFGIPFGVAIDSSNAVLVADSSHNRIQKFNSKGEYLTQFGSEGSGNGQFNNPMGIAVDGEGNIWVADSGNNRIQKFNSKGEYLTKVGTYGSGNGQFDWPWGIDVDTTGNVWVSDYNNNRIQKFNSKGEYLTKVGTYGSGNGQFALPSAISADSKGNVWITDTYNYRIQKFNSKGEYLTQFGSKGSGEGQLGLPREIAFDSKGGIWVVDQANNVVQRWAHGTAVTEAATKVGLSEATLNATINPKGYMMSYQFEYGETTSYGSKIPVSPTLIGLGTSNIAVSKTPTGLSSGTTYHFRVVAESPAGTVYGKDLKFTTLAAPPSFSASFGTEGSGNGQLFLPMGLSADPGGSVWVADTFNNRIQKFNFKGEYLSQFGTKGSGNGQLNFPSAVDVDTAGNIWVADTSNNRIQKFNSTGEYLTKFGSSGSGNGQFSAPRSLAIDSKGNIWVGDYANHRIQKFNSAGEYLTKFGSKGSGNGQFKFPTGIAIDSKDNIWVADYENNRLQKFNSAGEYLTKFGSKGSGNGQFKVPRGIAIDSKDNIWVADSENNRIQKFNSAGEYLSQAGQGSGAEAEPWMPSDVAVDLEGNVWVAEAGRGRIQMWFFPGSPFVSTEAATKVNPSEATLNAVVNPKGFETTYQFEYGKTVSYGSKAPISPKVVGSGGKYTAVGETIKGLESGITYHFRVVATNSKGTSYGKDMTFTT